MMKRNYLWALIASLVMVGCSNNDDPATNNEGKPGEESYLAINIASAHDLGSRATTDQDFVDGTADEAAVKSAIVFFFDGNGNPVKVHGDYNYRRMAVGDVTADNSANVESNVQLVALLEDAPETPKKVAVVLNWLYEGVALSVDQLAQKLAAEHLPFEQNFDFVMSNSAYMADGKVVNCTEIGPGHYANSKEGAQANPVTIYVERLAVKTSAKLNTEATNTKYNATLGAFDTGVTYTDAAGNAGNKVYVKITHWDLNTVNTDAYIIKHLKPEWATNAPFDGWNEPEKFRSYWALAYEPSIDKSGFAKKSFTWEGISNDITTNTPEYCLENTNTEARTKALFKGVLCDENGDSLTIYQWYSSYYMSEALLKAAMLENINQQLKTKGGASAPQLTVDQFDIVYATKQTAAADYYKGFATLEEGVTDAEVATGVKISDVLKDIPYVKRWWKGGTYYYTPFKHISGADAVIRNHFYQLVVQEVKGLGTPGNNPDPDDPENPDPEIPEPVDPTDEETYISAKVNVLSWRIFTNNVILGK